MKNLKIVHFLLDIFKKIIKIQAFRVLTSINFELEYFEQLKFSKFSSSSISSLDGIVRVIELFEARPNTSRQWTKCKLQGDPNKNVCFLNGSFVQTEHFCPFTMLQNLSKCEVKAWLCWNLLFYCHSDFMWNQILVNSDGQKLSFLAILEVLNFDFEPFLNSQIYQNSKLRVSEIVKMLEIQILPKLISYKINWQINSCIVDLNFTFWKFLEHSAICWWKCRFQILVRKKKNFYSH